MNVAILLTCFNRIDKTLACLESLFTATCPTELQFKVFLVDDNSPDKTALIVKKKFPQVDVVNGDGNLFWAGGMRFIWTYAMKNGSFDGFLLLNDDVQLAKNVLTDLMFTHKYCKENFSREGAYVSTTIDFSSDEWSYGGRRVINLLFKHTLKIINCSDIPKKAMVANANILLIMKSIVDKIGIFNEKYTHGIADYDYTLSIVKAGFPLLIAPNIGGYCPDDHGKNWLDSNLTFRKRVEYLYSPKGLAYKEYLFYLWRHFPLQIPYYFSLIWLKTFFPIIWEKLK